MTEKKFDRSYVRLLQEQLRIYKKQNDLLAEELQNARLDKQELYQQLQLNQEHEKLSLIRQQHDYKRIVDLEKQVQLLTVASGPTQAAYEAPKDVNPQSYSSEEAEDAVYVHQSDVQPPEYDEDNDEMDIEIHYEDPEFQAIVDHAAGRIFTSTQSKSSEEVPEGSKVSKTEANANDSLDPSLVSHYFQEGLRAAKEKQTDQAILHFTKVAEILPNTAPSILNLAILYAQKGKISLARDFAKRALELGSASALQVLAKLDAAKS